MAPILLNVAASVAGNVIDSVREHFSHHHGVKKAAQAATDDFEAELANAQPAAATPATTALAGVTAPVDTQSTLMTQLLGSPEVSTALASANPAQPVQVEMSAAGGVSLRNSRGELHALNVSDATRAVVSQLYQAHQADGVGGKGAAPAVLAVDPSHVAAAEWSKLPARTA